MSYIPCEKQIQDVIEKIELYISNNPDQFQATNIDQLDENPNVFSVSSIDKDGFANIAILGISQIDNTVQYLCLDQVRSNHDEQEGIDSEDSKCWWNAKTLENFLIFFRGELRSIVREQYENSSA